LKRRNRYIEILYGADGDIHIDGKMCREKSALYRIFPQKKDEQGENERASIELDSVQ